MESIITLIRESYMKWLGLKASPAQCATIMLMYNKMDKMLAGEEKEHMQLDPFRNVLKDKIMEFP